MTHTVIITVCRQATTRGQRTQLSNAGTTHCAQTYAKAASMTQPGNLLSFHTTSEAETFIFMTRIGKWKGMRDSQQCKLHLHLQMFRKKANLKHVGLPSGLKKKTNKTTKPNKQTKKNLQQIKPKI